MSTLTIAMPELATTPGPVGVLVEALLREQRELTAVERFSQFHEGAAEPLLRGRYAGLMPASPPGPGQQYAFEVDLGRCSGCKACVAACHALNGLDEGESWRDVGLLVGGGPGLPVLQHVTTSCHHCLEPACASACPVNAYEKDPITGIVRHLDDQCIGCKYCTMACPYDAPRYHADEGIVRKCDLCGDRLRNGEAPACVQSCPHEAIAVRVVDAVEVAELASAGAFLPGAADPGPTRPTTRYRADRPMPPDAEAADAHRIEPDHAHGPLIVMLVLTQLAAGGFLFALAGRLVGLAPGPLGTASLGALLVGLAASLAHLGRPLLAYRAVIGVRHSWLSREVVAFGLFAALASAFVLLEAIRPAASTARPILGNGLLAATVAAGILGVACSVMVYHATRRPFWSASRGGSRFVGTTLELGLAVALLCRTWDGAASGAVAGLWAGLAAVALARVVSEAEILNHRDGPRTESLTRSTILIRGPLAAAWMGRVAVGMASGVVIPLILAGLGGETTPVVARGLASIAFVGLVVGAMLERFLFFSAVSRPGMPGGLHS